MQLTNSELLGYLHNILTSLRTVMYLRVNPSGNAVSNLLRCFKILISPTPKTPEKSVVSACYNSSCVASVSRPAGIGVRVGGVGGDNRCW
jgi:hypothetical protein